MTTSWYDGIPIVLNPEAIGDPNRTPVVRLPVRPVACGRCGRPFDPADKEPFGAAEYRDWGFCCRCVDRCHESTDAFHQCVICRGEA